ncbi:MAG: magnesium transporter CorA family protein [Candidatus Diapherotrites archaeon]|nr:magnesium transporter CorA family protein [Candidatus Diapherotrites archaeon]
MQILKKTINDADFKELKEVQKGCWINSMNPSKEEASELIKKLELDEEIIEDFLDETSTPRVEIEGNNTYILIKVPVKEKNELRTTTLGIIVGPEFILTITPSSSVSPITDFLEKKDVSTTQKTKFVLTLLEKTIELFDKKTNYVSKQVNAKRKNIQKLTNTDMITIVEFEEVLNDFVSSLVPITTIIRKIKTGKILPIYDADQEMLEDLIITANDSLNLSNSRIKTISNIREAHSTILSNNLNKTMKTLTAITILLTIPTIISSIYGMNIGLPLQENTNAFLYVIIIVLLISIALIALFRKQDWM